MEIWKRGASFAGKLQSAAMENQSKCYFVFMLNWKPLYQSLLNFFAFHLLYLGTKICFCDLCIYIFSTSFTNTSFTSYCFTKN